MKFNIKEVREICKGVRSAASRLALQPKLDGWCARCSMAIAKALVARGYKPELCYGNFNETHPHCWVECCGYVIDVTATQFGRYPEILIEPWELNHPADGDVNRYPEPEWRLGELEWDQVDKQFKDWIVNHPTPEIVEQLLAA